MLHSKAARIILVSLLSVALLGLAAVVVLNMRKPEWTMEQFVDKFIEARTQFGFVDLNQESNSSTSREDLLAQVKQKGDTVREQSNVLELHVVQGEGPEVIISFSVYRVSDYAQSTFDSTVNLLDQFMLQPHGEKAAVSSALNAKIVEFPKVEGSRYAKMFLIGKTILSVSSDDSAIVNSILAFWGF